VFLCRGSRRLVRRFLGFGLNNAAYVNFAAGVGESYTRIVLYSTDFPFETDWLDSAEVRRQAAATDRDVSLPEVRSTEVIRAGDLTTLLLRMPPIRAAGLPAIASIRASSPEATGAVFES